MSVAFRRGSHNRESKACTFNCVICNATRVLRIWPVYTHFNKVPGATDVSIR